MAYPQIPKDPNGDGDRSFGTPRLGAVIEKKNEYCCIGLVNIFAEIAFSENTKTSISYKATVQVETKTKCIDIKCEGRDWANPFQYSTCNLELRPFNEAATMNSQKFNIIGTNMSLKIEGIAKKLGCCDDPACPELTNSTTHTTTGVVPGTLPPGAQAQRIVKYEILDKFGFDGDEAEPKFKPCCKTPDPLGGPPPQPPPPPPPEGWEVY